MIARYAFGANCFTAGTDDLLQRPDCKLASREVNLQLSSVEAHVDGMAGYQVVIDNAFGWLT